MSSRKKKLVPIRYDQTASSKQEDLELEKIICTVYDADVTLEEIMDLDLLTMGPNKEEMADNMLQEQFELALIQVLDKAELDAIRDKMNEMIHVIEALQELCDDAVFESRLASSYVDVVDERKRYQRLLTSSSTLIDSSCSFSFLLNGGNILLIDDDAHKSYDSLVRNMVYLFDSNLDKVQTMLETISSAQESIELCESIHELEHTLNEQERLIKSMDEIHNKVPPVKRDSIMLNHHMDKVITWNGDRSHVEPMTSDLQQDEEEMEERMGHLIEQRIMDYLGEEEDRMVRKDDLIKKRLKDFVHKTKFGYQGFSLPEDERMVEHVVRASTGGGQKSPEKDMSSPLASIRLSQIDGSGQVSLMSSTTSTTSNTVQQSPSPKAKNMFGYEAPEHMKRRAQLMLTKKQWRMKDNRMDQHYNKYKNQQQITNNLKSQMDLYQDIKQRSSLMIDDKTLSNEEYSQFISRSADQEDENDENVPNYSITVSKKRFSKIQKMGNISLFEMSDRRNKHL
ncbi:DNA polymerase III PolC-type [Acrasis kona]|uniref:DNA polymerase III PolC-type n=1 Tax=Acrasis kona TaxID=1008807 RepID=A0AAW2YN55_9EUKA